VTAVSATLTAESEITVALSQPVTVLDVDLLGFSYAGLTAEDGDTDTGTITVRFSSPLSPGGVLSYSAGGAPIVTTGGNVQLPINLTVV
jgi:hypothetical protein